MSYIGVRQKNLLSIVKYPLFTSKAESGYKKNQYSFAVDSKSNKATIKTAIEELFAVKVVSVNTSLFPLKNRCLRGRFGISRGKNARYKRAVVKLVPEDNIGLSSETE